MRLAVASAGLLLCCAPALAAAQQGGSGAVDVPTLGDCPLAARIVSSGRLAPRGNWAYGIITTCGAEGGRALAAGLRALRSEADTVALERFPRHTHILRDAAIADDMLLPAGLEERRTALRSVTTRRGARE